MTALPEVFRCTALSCTLTRSGCGDRHLRAKNNGRPRHATPSKATQQKRDQRARRPICDAVRLGKSIERAQARARAMVAPPSGPGILEGDGDGRGPEAVSGLAATLTRLGYVVEDAGLVPAGRLLLVRSEARA